MSAKRNAKATSFPENIIIAKTEINDVKVIAKKINKFFVNVRQNLASEVSESDISFKSFKITTIVNKTYTIQEEINEAFKYLKRNTSFGSDALHEKCLYSELFWSVFSPNIRKGGPEQL